nr:hypothetical protein [Pseudomonadota bacterium]
VDIASIRFYSTFAGSGLADKDKHPIFVQVYSHSQPLQYFTLRFGLYPMLLSAIPYEQFHQIIADLPNDWRSNYLRCLNLVPEDLAIFQRIEDAVVKQIGNTEVQHGKTIPANTTSDLDLLDDNRGLLYMQVHYHLESWLFLCDRMPEFAKKNVRVCYVEMAKIALTPLFLEFERTGDEAVLKEHLDIYNLTMTDLIPLFYQLAVSAKRHGILVLPVDSSTATGEEVSSMEKLNAWNQRRNNLVAANISIYQHERNHPKFVALYGAMHLPIAKKLNVPSVLLRTDGRAVSFNLQRIKSEHLENSFELIDFKDVDLVAKLPSLRPKKPCCSLFRFGLFSVLATSLVYNIVKRLQVSDEQYNLYKLP